MADTHPNLNLTPEEKRVFYQLFQEADKTNIGVVTGEVAVSFFEKTNLPSETLGLIWQIADTQNRGLLTPSGFGVVMRLIGHAQAGRAPTEELALQPGPLPKFTGLTTDTAPAPAPVASSPPPNAGPVRVPPLNPDDINKFSALFSRSEVQNGLLQGDKAKQIFERAQLPNEVLGRIWNLADTKQRGALDSTEFIIAMHLLSAYRTGAMKGIPQVLPQGLYDAAARRAGPRTSTGSRPSPDVPPVPAIPKQFTGPAQRAQSPLRPQFTASSALGQQQTGPNWIITPQEKSHYDAAFDTVDTSGTGSISGDVAVEFFSKAQLPEETLAQIWDLADIDSDGQLNKDEFAVAMHLVRGQRTGREPLPQTLPPNLIPPSMRRQVVPPPQPIQPQTTAGSVPRTAAEDLFGLDVFGPPPPQPQAAQSTGGSNPQFQAPSSPTAQPSSATTFKPFVPSSSFGQSLNPQGTGFGAAAQTRSPPPPADDLLGDAEPEESKKLTQETSDLANLSNQIGTLSKEMQNVQGKRGAAEQDLAQSTQQKRDFEARLAQARSMYEQEVKDYKALEERLNASRAETQKLQQDFAMIDGSRQDLQTQYNQAAAALEADQRENAALKEKIRQANAQVAQLKPQLDKVKSEARQQKGLVAINKKQLATVEGERDRIQGDIDATTKELDELQREGSHHSGSASPSKAPSVSSPAASTASQTNPFFRRTTSNSERAFSPPPQGGNKDHQSVFDSVFGTSFPASTSTPPPPTSFRTESPAQGASSPQLQAPAVTKTSEISGEPTPSASPRSATADSEPPPPPQSRQFTPNALPIEGHQLSEASSVKPSPPASRFGTEAASEASTSEVSGPGSSTVDLGAERSPLGQSRESVTPKNQPGSEDQAHSAAAPGAFPSPTPPAESSSKKDVSFDELFGGPAHERSQSQKANDFEEAFAAMKPRHTGGSEQANGGQGGGDSSEFPPIRELGDDDDSTDSEGPGGFDDDFTPVSPKNADTMVKDASGESIAAFPPTAGIASSNTPLPGPNEQPSPPKYERDVSKEAHGAPPPEFNGLLPGREDPTSPSEGPHSVEHSTGAPIVGGVPQRDVTSPEAAAKKPAGPDFEAAFAGLDLAPAKEADDDEDDDDDDFESPFNKDSSNFDISFDSPAAHSKSSTQGGQSGTSQGNTGVGADFFTFDNSNKNNNANSSTINAASTGSPAALQQAPGQAVSSPSSSHDWDALFSVLDGAKDSAAAKKTLTEEAQPEATPAAFPQPPTQKQPGWALTADSGEDDMILRRLTSMGYPRDESLAALEKFDYNLDKAADFLASKS